MRPVVYPRRRARVHLKHTCEGLTGHEVILEGRWHASQNLTPQTDGSLIAEFQLSATEEIKNWLLSFSRHAVVLVPESLRSEITEELKALLAAYTSGGENAPRPRRTSRVTSKAASKSDKRSTGKGTEE